MRQICQNGEFRFGPNGSHPPSHHHPPRVLRRDSFPHIFPNPPRGGGGGLIVCKKNMARCPVGGMEPSPASHAVSGDENKCAGKRGGKRKNAWKCDYVETCGKMRGKCRSRDSPPPFPMPSPAGHAQAARGSPPATPLGRPTGWRQAARGECKWNPGYG